MFTKKDFIFWLIIIAFIFLRWVSSRPIYKEGQLIRISARVNSEPTRYANSQVLTLADLKISLPSYPEIYYGDFAVVEGLVSSGKLNQAKLISTKENINFIYNFRKKLIEYYQYALPEPHSALIAGIVIGSKSSLPADFWNSLKNTGTAHVVVASGMNVTLTAGLLLAILLIFLNRKKALILAISGVWIYVLLSGFDAPIIRAAIMVSIAYLAQLTGRLTNIWRVLFLTISVMLMINPNYLRDLGFILSFTATASLMFFQKFFNRLFKRLPRIIREDLVTTTSAQIGVAPVLYLVFGQFNLMSPIINTLVLWTVAPIMIIGAVGGIIGMIFPFLGRYILYLAYPMTWWFTSVIKIFG